MYNTNYELRGWPEVKLKNSWEFDMEKIVLEVFDQDIGANTGELVEVMVDLNGFEDDIKTWDLEQLSDVYAQYTDDTLQVCCEVQGKDPGSMQYTKHLAWMPVPTTMLM